MALSIDPATQVITIPQADLTFVTGTLYEMDTNQFRLDLLALLDDEAYIWMAPAFTHNTEVTVAGTTFARTIEMINGWSIVFSPDSQWSVRFVGSNNNLFDIENGILNQNQVQVIPSNSAGLIVTTTGSGLSAAQDAKLTNIDTRATATDRAIRNRYVINRTTGMIDIYNDAGTAILDSVPIYEDQDAATPVGSTITRIDRREKIDL